jgi:hypothetical protein
MRAGLLVLLIAACAPKAATTPRVVEDDLDMPPPGAMKDTDAPATNADPPPAPPEPAPTAAVAAPPATPAPAAPASTADTSTAGTEPARPVAAWPPPAGSAIEAIHELPDAQRVVAPPGKGLRTGTIARDQLIAVLNAGPGTFLRQLEVAPRLSGDRFVGWQLVQLIDRNGPLNTIDLLSGDVLLAVNGNSLSRPEQLQAMWDSLRTANEVTAHLWRGDKKFDLRFKIEPRAP